MTALLLPDVVRFALSARLTHVSRRDLRAPAATTSDAYRGGHGTQSVIRTADDALAYARMPATYAAVVSALAAAKAHLGDVELRSLLDFGAGTGAASIASSRALPALDAVTLVEPNKPMAELGAALVREAGINARLLVDDATRAAKLVRADVVAISYVLVEMEPAAASTLVRAALAAANELVVLVDPGTPAGFAQLRVARDIVREAGWSIAAPCPHTAACPLVAPDWCHFKVRLPRTREHKQIKAADAPFEDEPYSYLVASRRPVTPAPGRVLRAPVVGKADVALRICGSAGAKSVTVTKRNERFKAARKLDAGDPWTA